jgi:hypothetical protein
VAGRTGTNNTLCSSVERFDPLTGQWSTVAPMSTNRCAFGLAAMNGKLYAVDGKDNTNTLGTFVLGR